VNVSVRERKWKLTENMHNIWRFPKALLALKTDTIFRLTTLISSAG